MREREAVYRLVFYLSNYHLLFMYKANIFFLSIHLSRYISHMVVETQPKKNETLHVLNRFKL